MKTSWKWKPSPSREMCMLMFSDAPGDYVNVDADPDNPDNKKMMDLIAAAPDLLAALEGLNYYGDAKVFCCCPRKDGVAEDRFHSTACSDARAAIKKARGE